MVNDSDVPVHPFAVGVTVIVDWIGVEPLLVAVNAAISPCPFVARPMAVLVFVQLYTVAETKPVKAMVLICVPLQTV